jgi:hypothetical protein
MASVLGGDRAHCEQNLLPGKKVFVVAAPTEQGGLEALRVVVERDGVAPPM